MAATLQRGVKDGGWIFNPALLQAGHRCGNAHLYYAAHTADHLAIHETVIFGFQAPEIVIRSANPVQEECISIQAVLG